MGRDQHSSAGLLWNTRPEKPCGLTPSTTMTTCFPAINASARPGRANGGYANQVSLGVPNRGCQRRPGPGPGPGCVATNCQKPNVRSHQRRWSADYSKCGTSSPVLIVKKNKKEPPPPQRGVSLLRPHAASHHSSKRYSCPPIGNSPRPSSSSSSSSSCSSPPPVQTSVITGRDPLGWKLHPKRKLQGAGTNRLSLQIPLPVISPEPRSGPDAGSQSVAVNPDPPPRTKPRLKPKPPRRRHSDSSTFLGSLATPQPAVTLEDLCTVHLRPLTLVDESDDVFSGGNEEEVTTQRRKIPPPVPEKTTTTREIAQRMVHSVTAGEEILYTVL